MKKWILLGLLTTATPPLFAWHATEGSTFIVADLLVWKLREGSADNWAQEITPDAADPNVNLLNVPFKWDPGFRIGIGYQSSHKCWDAIFSYTHFQTTGTRQAAVNSGGIYSAFTGNYFAENTNGSEFGPHYYGAGINWNFDFNAFDLEFGRHVRIDEVLSLRPFIGVKGASINQRINTAWIDPTESVLFTTATENLKHDFWGIGPSIGVDTTWPFYKIRQHQFNLIGNISGAMLWGNWHFSDLYQNDTPVSITVNTDSIHSAATMARGLMGIEWITGVYGENNLNVRLGYEAQVWFNQMQYIYLSTGRLSNLMSLQGLVLDFSLNF